MGNSLICLGQIRRIVGETRAICWEFRIASRVPVAKLRPEDRNRPALTILLSEREDRLSRARS